MSLRYMMLIKNPEELWANQKAKLILIFPNLHDHDFFYEIGEKDAMMDLIQNKIGRNREDLELLISGL